VHRPSPSDTAAHLRTARRRIVEGLSSGDIRLGDLIGTDDDGAEWTKVVVLAEAVPGVGKVRSRRVLEAVGIADGTRWGELPRTTAAALVAALEAAAAEAAAAEPRGEAGHDRPRRPDDR
jgi:S13-like protein